jgi:hypothetical protein
MASAHLLQRHDTKNLAFRRRSVQVSQRRRPAHLILFVVTFQVAANYPHQDHWAGPRRDVVLRCSALTEERRERFLQAGEKRNFHRRIKIYRI